ncbi:hypothetical protein [Denitromonas ohlonensis]|uniref:Uncharacterized protein n=2 Tax=Denitromonas TaxID=139331 RepID=A0A557RNW6_9RHOO|nr:hypothetical protein [Denitromonas ohlonensis]TVO66873.1 hypothetical protein FHP90_09410 [Denitromonas ohlonensis]TVO79743.1 hypothetical protein FHP89_00595 [Denitromonas ohlonensis]
MRYATQFRGLSGRYSAPSRGVRALYEGAIRRHFLGEIMAVDRGLCRLEGFAFVYDAKLTVFLKRPERRFTIVDLGDSGYVVNVIDSCVDIDAVTYQYLSNIGLVATDGKSFVLNINEFAAKG